MFRSALGFRVGKAQETDENLTLMGKPPPEEPLGYGDTDAPVRAPLKPKPHPRSWTARSEIAEITHGCTISFQPSRVLGAGALVDRVLSTGHPVGVVV